VVSRRTSVKSHSRRPCSRCGSLAGKRCRCIERIHVDEYAQAAKLRQLRIRVLVRQEIEAALDAVVDP
jgi:hypothetical protein